MESTDLQDLFIAHIGAIDAFALGLEVAYSILTYGKLSTMLRNRYSSFNSEAGKSFEEGKRSLEDLAHLATEYGEDEKNSSKQELIENLLNAYLFCRNTRW